MEIVPGFTTEQKVSIVAANDTDINAELTTQNADNWIAATMTLSGSDMVILFTRTQPAS